MKLVILAVGSLLGTASAQADVADTWMCRAKCVIMNTRGDELTDRFAATRAFQSQEVDPLKALASIESQCKNALNPVYSDWVVESVVISMEKRFRPFPNGHRYDLVTVLATPGNACAKL